MSQRMQQVSLCVIDLHVFNQERWCFGKIFPFQHKQEYVRCFWLGQAPEEALHLVQSIVSALYVCSCTAAHFTHFMWSLWNFECACVHKISFFILYSKPYLNARLSLYTGNTLTSPGSTCTRDERSQCLIHSQANCVSESCNRVLLNHKKCFLFVHSMKLYLYRFLHQLIPYTHRIIDFLTKQQLMYSRHQNGCYVFVSIKCLYFSCQCIIGLRSNSLSCCMMLRMLTSLVSSTWERGKWLIRGAGMSNSTHDSF